MLKNYNIEEIGNYGVIYCLTSPSSKCYIGQSWDIKSRFKKYRTDSNSIKNQRKLYNAIKKYKSYNFKYEIIDLCETQEEMDNKEKFYIDLYNSIDNGYNIKDGGSNGKHSKETKIKMSISHKGKIIKLESRNKMSKAKKGICLSQETRNKMRNSRIGHSLSQETKNKIGASNKGKSHKGRIVSLETRNKISKNNKGKKRSNESRALMSKNSRGVSRPKSIFTKEDRENYRLQLLRYTYTIKNILTNEIIVTNDLISYCKYSNLKYKSICSCIKGNRIYKKYLYVTKSLTIKNN